MDCERVQNLLSELLDDSLPESERTDVFAHLRECLPCRAVKEGLEETLLLLRNLPPGKAPTELLDGVRRRISQAEAPATPLWKKLFLPAHIKIPLEAAAAVLLFFLVYGAQKEELPKPFSPKPAARMDAAPTAFSEAEGGKAKTGQESEKAKEFVKPVEKKAVPGGGRPVTQSSLPVAPVQRVSTAGERIEPAPVATPPSRLAQPVPFGGEMTIEVAAQNRAGLEERIAAAATRLGGSVQGTPVRAGADAEIPADAVSVHLPADSAKPFLAELSKLGTLPAEGMSGWPGLPAEPSPEVVAYTVRIRVR